MANGKVGRIYLIAYNIFQLMGWSWVFLIFLHHMFTEGDYTTLWPRIRIPLSFFQTLQTIEVLHCLLGLVRASALTTWVQISSRLFVIWGLAHPLPETRSSFGLFLITLCWCLAETTRYKYYAYNLIDWYPFEWVKYALVWCRYTFFIVLYPLGVTGELLMMKSSLETVRETRFMQFSLPNPLNISFHYDIMTILFMLMYIPGLPALYGYMLGQRRKILGGNGAKKVQ